MDIKEIAKKLYDVLYDRQWSRDDWHELNYCISCGASIKGTKLPNHKGDCDYVEAMEAFEEWIKVNG